jgi:hypothetical protein
MSTLPPIVSFWHGALGWLGRVAIASFLEKGHSFALHAYDDVGPVPSGCEIRDANAIVPRAEMFFYKGNRTPAVFADYFRLKLMEAAAGIWVDCDVLQADGGTRTAAITGASVAVSLACLRLVGEGKIAESPIKRLVAAVSAGVIDGIALLDLDYEEDKAVAVDLNLVATEDGALVEVQGAGEEATFSHEGLLEMLALGRGGIAQLIAAQRAVLDQVAVAAAG